MPPTVSPTLTHPHNGRTLKQEDYIAGLAKGLAILDCFDTGRSKLSVTQAAERTGLTRTAARRHLRTLHYLGYLDSDGQSFWLTHKILKPAGIYISTAVLPKIARPVLLDLANRSGCYHSLVVLDGPDAVTLASSYPHRNAPHHVLPYGIYPGNRVAAHCGANGKILLSSLATDALDHWLALHPLTRFTPFTLTDETAFRAELDQIRNQGFATAKGEYEPGFGALSVPVTDSEGRCIAALNAVDFQQNIDKANWNERLLGLLRETALYLKTVL